MTTRSTPPRTVKDLRARIKARGLGWVVECCVVRALGFRIMMWPGDNMIVTFEGPRLRCLELAWRIVEGERG
jgi:hypothetical protein